MGRSLDRVAVAGAGQASSPTEQKAASGASAPEAAFVLPIDSKNRTPAPDVRPLPKGKRIQ